MTSVFDRSGNTMTIRLRNQNNYPVTIASVFVMWNGSAGHSGIDPTLDLVSASVGGIVFWSDPAPLPASSKTIVPQNAAVIPASSNNINLSFNFDQSYDNWGTERVTITFNQPTGCALNILDVSR